LQQSSTQQPVSKPERATMGFAFSLTGALVILAQGLIRIVRGEITFLGSDEIRRRILAGLALGTIGIIAIVFAVLIMIGAYLIFNSETEVAGGVIVLLFSTLSIIAGGGWLIGLILGIVGGILGLLKK
jgi:hypothetical protein